MMLSRPNQIFIGTLAAMIVAWMPMRAVGQGSEGAMPAKPKMDRAEPLPGELEGVGITEQLGKVAPLDLTFTDSAGKPVALRQYFRQNRPVILNLGYFGCPMLCGLVMNGLLEAMREIDMMPGRDYDVLSISFDPSETSVLARLKKQNYIKEFGHPEAAGGWHFLVGDEQSTKKLTEAVGYGFKWNAPRGEFAHAAVIIVLTPDGTVSRYLYGVQFPPRTLRLSLVEASQGKIGSTLDRILLYCFHYDAGAGEYTPAAMNIMRLGGGVTAAALAGLIGFALLREAHCRKRAGRQESLCSSMGGNS